jgi:hypothetical protein
MSNPNPIDDETLFDTVIIDGVTSPGVVKLTGHDLVVDWDVKEANGQNFASTTMKGRKLGRFTLSFFLADRDDWDAWQEIVEILQSTIAPKPRAVQIYHPDLVVPGIESVVLESIGGVVHDGKGGQTVVVKLLEYRPPRKAGGPAKGKDPNAAANAELEALTAKYNATPWG